MTDKHHSSKKKKIQEEKRHCEPFYKVGVKYSLTVAPDDSRQFFKRKSRIARWAMSCRESFTVYDGKDIQYMLWPDVSMPCNSTVNRDPRLHWHGTVEFTSNLGILYWLMYWHETTSWCILDVDTIDNEEDWLKYCKKSLHILGPIKPLKNHEVLNTSDGSESS